MKPYTVAVDLAAMELWEGLSARERRSVLSFLQRLSSSPFTQADLQEMDAGGRLNDVALMDDLLIHYWVDHAERTVRVTRFETL